jgi:site-specific recombinase XerD
VGLGSPREFESPPRRLFLQDESGKKSDFDLNGININNFEKFSLIQRNLSKATVKNHVRYLNIFMKYFNRDFKDTDINDIQDFMLNIKKKRTSATYKIN